MGLYSRLLRVSRKEFNKFLERDLTTPKAELVIPDVTDALIKSSEATIKVLDTDSRWFAKLHAKGEYPENLFK